MSQSGIDNVAAAKFLGALVQPKEKLKSDYDHTLNKSYLIKASVDAAKQTTNVPSNGNEPNMGLAWKYELGKSLVAPHMLSNLLTQLRALHEWYIERAKQDVLPYM